MIRLLSEVSSLDVKQIGGKAAGLGEMLQANIPVPPGFVVTTTAYYQGMTEELKDAILVAFDELGANRVAVRSSAVAEDSSNASWAGQLDTYLNTTRKDLIEAVKKCWASINSIHAKSYAQEHKVAKDQRAVAVVVQTMVDSEVSGVMFTVNPVTGDRNQYVIEAAWGLGEMLVQGAITPESFIVNKLTQEVLTHDSSKQTKMLIYENESNQEVTVPQQKLNKPVLSIKHLKDLLILADDIEQHYGKPQDIEWAISNDKLYIVQSRPVTTLSQEQ